MSSPTSIWLAIEKLTDRMDHFEAWMHSVDDLIRAANEIDVEHQDVLRRIDALEAQLAAMRRPVKPGPARDKKLTQEEEVALNDHLNAVAMKHGIKLKGPD